MSLNLRVNKKFHYKASVTVNKVSSEVLGKLHKKVWNEVLDKVHDKVSVEVLDKVHNKVWNEVYYNI